MAGSISMGISEKLRRKTTVASIATAAASEAKFADRDGRHSVWPNVLCRRNRPPPVKRSNCHRRRRRRRHLAMQWLPLWALLLCIQHNMMVTSYVIGASSSSTSLRQYPSFRSRTHGQWGSTTSTARGMSSEVCKTTAFVSPTVLPTTTQRSSNRYETRLCATYPSKLGGAKTSKRKATRKTSTKSVQTNIDAWRAIISALKLYKAAFGDANVPATFVVPNMAPWPRPAWGLALGQVLYDDAALSAEQRQQLQQMGVDVVKQQAKHSGTSAPADGAAASASSSSAEQDVSNDSNNQKPSANDIRFQNVLTALRVYRDMYKDLLVPQPFVVPRTTDWPVETHNIRLGARVNAIRSQGTFITTHPERKQLLDDLGFVWQPISKKSKEEEEEDDDKVDDAANNAWSDDESKALFDLSSTDLRDFDFGGVSGRGSIRQDGNDDDDIALSLSPSWGLSENAGVPALQDLHAMGSRADLKNVPDTADENYAPPRTLADSLREAEERARQVGIVESMQNGRVVKGKQQKDIPWFNDDFGSDFVFDDVVEALSVYKSLHGDMTNLTRYVDFVVPTRTAPTGFLDNEDDDDDFDEFDFDVSARAAQAIAGFDRDILENDDNDGDGALDDERLSLDDRATTARAVAARPVTAVADATDWPEYLAGMQLGSIAARIRVGSLEVKHLTERKARLDDIGFDWGDPKYFIDVPFEKAMCAMYAYYLIRGDMFVEEDFVMPDEDPWPRVLAGYAIGQDVRRIRELQDFFEAYHPDKVSLLRLIDFMWFPTLAVPLDPNEPVLTDEFLKLNALGHPDYAKMIDIPMGLPDKIIADGPFYDSDDPKDWWRKWHNWDYVQNYWYALGRRDNAFVLRGMGYPQMAAEHEAKYGPGLLARLNETLQVASDADQLGTMDVHERRQFVQNLNYFRGEMLGCEDVHPEQREQVVLELENKMRQIVSDYEIEFAVEDDDENNNSPQSSAATTGQDEVLIENDDDDFEFDDGDDAELDDDFVLEEFDYEDDLGLSSSSNSNER